MTISVEKQLLHGLRMNNKTDWNYYYEKRLTNPISKPLKLALNLFASEKKYMTKSAIDLGCGSGTDTIHLLREHWSVLAIDNEPKAIAYINQATSNLAFSSQLTTKQSSFENIAMLPISSLINACYSLHLLSPAYFYSFWNIIKASLVNGGRISGILLGKNDAWYKFRPMTFLSRSECLDLFTGFEIEKFDEIERDQPLINGTLKHWHIYSIVAKKK